MENIMPSQELNLELSAFSHLINWEATQPQGFPLDVVGEHSYTTRVAFWSQEAFVSLEQLITGRKTLKWDTSDKWISFGTNTGPDTRKMKGLEDKMSCEK